MSRREGFSCLLLSCKMKTREAWAAPRSLWKLCQGMERSRKRQKKRGLHLYSLVNAGKETKQVKKKLIYHHLLRLFFSHFIRKESKTRDKGSSWVFGQWERSCCKCWWVIGSIKEMHLEDLNTSYDSVCFFLQFSVQYILYNVLFFVFISKKKK